MARNKRDIDRQLKQAEIEAAACRLFLTQGYDHTSMAAVAAAAAVAPNTLYWYFANKDELLIAVLDSLVGRALLELTRMHDRPLVQQIKWLLREFAQADKLVTTVHARLTQSEPIRAWHERFHTMLDAIWIERLVAGGMSRKQATVMATVGTYVVEGLLSHPHTSLQFERIVAWLGDMTQP